MTASAAFIPDIDIRPEHWQIVRHILRLHVPDFAVWAFGSRAKRTAKPHSDLDLAVITDKPLTLSVSASLSDDFSDSDLPWKVDVVDWATTSASFREIIARDKVVLQEPGQLGNRRETTLADICRQQGGSIQTGPFGSQLHASDYTPTGIPVVMPINLVDGRICEQNIARISEQMASRLTRHQLKPGDIVFSRRGDVTRFALVSEHETDWLCGTGCLKVSVGKPTMAVSPFIATVLASAESKEWLVRHAVGATMLNLNTEILGSVPVTLPPLAEQHAISHILSTLDDKIELNRRMNQTLESMAQALFRSWFVDFDGVVKKDMQKSEFGLIPKGWRVGSIYDIATVRYGAPFASSKFNTLGNGLPLVRIRDLRNECPGVWTPEIHPKGYLIQPGDIIVGMDGEFRAYLWGGTSAWMNQRVCAFHPKKPHCSVFVHNAIAPHLAHVEATEVATTVIHLGKGDIDEFRVVIPPNEIAEKFKTLCQPLYDKIVAGKQQAATLAALRDSLLPKLLSGDLSVVHLDQEVDGS